MTYSVYCSNTSDSWNNGIEIYDSERPMDDIYVTAVCRYVIYIPPIINGISKVDVCEIETSGCPLGKYGVNCKMNCSENCMLGSCDLVRGNCTCGCTDGWVGDRCNETCSEGWFGKQCLNECSPHCFMTSCDHVTGECIDGCNKGWTDYNALEDCKGLPTTHNAAVDERFGLRRNLDTGSKYKCDKDYKMKGNPFAVCQSPGEWKVLFNCTTKGIFCFVT
ncbi:unnamed protein product [Mytilus edulis]|uniref:Sushi domain-containing protein n=1 Tax=Mytilus edulis TaxID=6550 RepID=A0A8S3QBA2_MYTED|nr:unnamed protein product [Mytilus edulis]